MGKFLLLAIVVPIVTTIGDHFHDEEYQNMLVEIMLMSEKPVNKTFQFLKDNKIDSAPVDQTCFPTIGCFPRSPGGVFPEPPEFIQATFTLHTTNDESKVYSWNSTVGDEKQSIQEELRDRSKNLVFVAHGFGGYGQGEWVQEVKRLQTEKYKNTVIVIDWRIGARILTLYTTAAANVELVARIASKLAGNLMKAYPEIQPEMIHFVGFSLGGQMAGYFGRDMHEAGIKIGKITALDTAAPLFESHGIVPKREHTLFLEAVHTSAGRSAWRGKVGVEQDYGHVDYYPNGGVDQPGCARLALACSHTRAVEYYLEALSNDGLCRYNGHWCNSVDDARSGNCATKKDARHYLAMAWAMVDNPGIFYLTTNAAAPYCHN